MSIQIAELHYISPPEFDPEAIAERAEALAQSGVELTQKGDTLLYFHTNHSVEYDEGMLPAQTAVLTSDKPPEMSKYTDAITQSWGCDDAHERLEACTTTRLVSEVMARLIETTDRLNIFHGVLQACVELTAPHAIVFAHSQQVVSAAAYLDSCIHPPAQRTGAVNVRFFRVSNAEHDDMIMDTRGLGEIGLHDFQCHYRDLDPNAVSKILYNLAAYIVEKGDVIESGHTVPGIEPDSKWTCQFEESILEPKRDVLDLNPGSPYAAGSRNDE